MRGARQTREHGAVGADFEAVWNEIRSAAKRSTGGSFRIDAVDRSSLSVSGGAMQAPRRITRAEFARIFSVWEDYVAGTIPRSRMLPLSHNSTCILSILHATTHASR